MSATEERAPITDSSPLQRSYEPETLVGRARERSELLRSASEALEASDPSHVAVYGGDGTGKTLLVDAVAASIREDRDLAPALARVSCASEQRAYHVAIAVVNALRTENELASTGYPMTGVLERLSGELAARSAPLLLVLDDVQALDLGSRSLQDLFDVLLTDPDVAVVVVADDPRYRNELDWSLRQRFAGREVHFPAYEAETLRAVLRDRVDAAFEDGAVGDDVVEACATAAVEEGGGSAWTAIRLLRAAGRIAGERSSEGVERADVDAALDVIEASRVRDALPDSPHAGLALLALAETALDPERAPRMRHCYPAYEQLCRRIDFEPVGERAVHGYLRELRRADLLETERRHSESPGQYFRYELSVEPETAVDALRDTDLPAAAFDGSVVAEPGVAESGVAKSGVGESAVSESADR